MEQNTRDGGKYRLVPDATLVRSDVADDPSEDDRGELKNQGVGQRLSDPAGRVKRVGRERQPQIALKALVTYVMNYSQIGLSGAELLRDLLMDALVHLRNWAAPTQLSDNHIHLATRDEPW